MFDKPVIDTTEVQSFHARISDFRRFLYPPTVAETKSCAASGDGISAQNSILKLDTAKCQALLEGRLALPDRNLTDNKPDGQGFGLSAAQRKVVEMRAMQVARQIYEQEGWMVVDKSLSQPFDLLATKRNERRFIEVKGTTGNGDSVILTRNELKHARDNHLESVLIVVSGIIIGEAEGIWNANGGETKVHFFPWVILDSKLEATEFRYTI